MSGRALMTLLLFALLAARARADEVSSDAKAAGAAAFAEGTRLLAAGKDARPTFQRALEHFREASNDKWASPGACRNVGNAAFLAGDVPHAIAAFRAGLILEPQQPLLRANLDYARAQVQYPSGQHGRPERDPWPAWLPRWRAGTLLGIGAVAYAMAWLPGTVWWFQRGTWLSALALAGFGIAAGAGYGWWLHARQARLDRDSPPIVIRSDTSLLTGNGPSYPRHPELPLLRRGMEARRLGKRGDWLQVQLSSGEIGWIRSHDAWIISLADDPLPAVWVRVTRDTVKR